MAAKMPKLVPMEEFLGTYKRLEQVLRDAYGPDATVINYESKLDTGENDRMVQCRRIRNYAQHNPDAEQFLAVTEQMLEFLKSQVSRVMSELVFVDKIVKKIKPVTLDSDVKEACVWMLRRGSNFAPVADDKGRYVGHVTDAMVVHAVAKTGDASARIGSVWKAFPFEPVSGEAKVVYDTFMIAGSDAVKLLDNGGFLIVTKGPDKAYRGIVGRSVGNW